MDRFEYLILNEGEIVKEHASKEKHKGSKIRFLGGRGCREIVVKKLNELGAEGWELVRVILQSFFIFGSGGSTSTVYYLKKKVE